MRRLIGVGAFVVIAGLWEAAAALRLYNPVLLPPPSAAFRATIEQAQNGQLAADLMASLSRYGIGFGLGVAAGIAIGVLTGRSRFLRDALTPVFHFLRSIPSVALLPIVIVLFGISDSGKVGLVLWASFFPVWLATHLGLAEVRPEFVRAAQSLGARPSTLVGHVLLPSALPFVLSGLRVSIATGLFALAAGEMIGGSAGIGFRIFHSHEIFRTDIMVASTLLFGLIALTADTLVVFASSRLVPWSRPVRP